ESHRHRRRAPVVESRGRHRGGAAGLAALLVLSVAALDKVVTGSGPTELLKRTGQAPGPHSAGGHSFFTAAAPASCSPRLDVDAAALSFFFTPGNRPSRMALRKVSVSTPVRALTTAKGCPCTNKARASSSFCVLSLEATRGS